ncbi:gliding motility-associated C-terminal domain-containing protein [Aquimarina sp. D1M17]|uniref:T9SS type B sorting domain-containing protein n=1 Tax=Aquimarina acroporae TaxID=2937283 RepID=UPI0020BEFF75|nr:gliding motility-associated C-terminal domain-containing protein [Aquimarina acroporae]MCK8520325.1 gliding motility-associated C-terminal domain-containing protein [Aquimarina acroporae]
MKHIENKLPFVPAKFFTKTLLFGFIFLCDFLYAQCVDPGTITINVCSMETIDFDINGDPDGIVNIYNETGTTPADGTWSIDPRFSVAFDEATGNLSTWDLQFSTTAVTFSDYFFELRSVACGDVPIRSARVVLGPYSGKALAPFGTLNVNVEACDEDAFDLFNALTSDVLNPPPHLNGEWVYNGTSPNFLGIVGSEFSARIPYQPGLPLVDQEVFEFTYRVEGLSPCDPFDETTVRISMIRQVDPGAGQEIDICESEILAGAYDTDINLRDDTYLLGEDFEGIWTTPEPTGQISNELDAMVNIRAVYDQITAGGTNLRFGCESFSYQYNVAQRSGVCEDQNTSVIFTVYEELRPFNQITPTPELCRNTSGTINLFDLLEFTNQGGFDFIYDNSYYVNWRLVSGPSSLGLVEQPNTIETFDTSVDYYLGTVNLALAPAGTYVFEYGVTPDINCTNPDEICDPFVTDPLDPTFSDNPCDILTATVTIEILEFDYAGEDTDDIDLCEGDVQVDLRSLLDTNGTDTIVDTGIWTDGAGTVFDNDFVFPSISAPQDYVLTYTTTTSRGCVENAQLSFTLHPTPDAGVGSDFAVCSNDLTVTLFDLLTGTPDTTGTWTGPFGYMSTDHLGRFDMDDETLPILGPGNYTYTVPSNDGCPNPDTAIVRITVVEPVTIGTDRADTFCKIDGRVNLFTLLDRDTPRTGVFEDTDGTGVLTPEGVLEFETLTNEVYNFRYVVTNAEPCDESSLNVAVQIVDLPEPEVPNQEFCILDAARLEDIEVDVLNFNWYTTLESEIPIVDNPILLDNQVYYIANVDVDNCESERVAVEINILNTGERSSTGELCTLDFQDGVSPNGDNQNDTFDLFIEDVYNLPEAFPEFDLKIYNRYGTLVYEGRRDIQEFRGESNTSVRLGDDLPSGTYFYIFSPNFENNLPIQGSFYLSR